jgi:ribosomal protein S18 acetylase RimI-like enzyme
VVIEEAHAISSEVVDAVGRLVVQLSSSASLPTAEHLEAIVGSTASRLLLARDRDGAVVGMLTLALYRIPTHMCAWIEDVVVDERARGRGVGEQLTNAALALARDEGADMVDLTSRPTREAANRLYVRLGFRPRETNVYRFELQIDSAGETSLARSAEHGDEHQHDHD